jgi:hypothetical protein
MRTETGTLLGCSGSGISCSCALLLFFSISSEDRRGFGEGRPVMWWGQQQCGLGALAAVEAAGLGRGTGGYKGFRGGRLATRWRQRQCGLGAKAVVEAAGPGGGLEKGSRRRHARVSSKLHGTSNKTLACRVGVVGSGGGHGECEEEGAVTGEASGGGAQGRGQRGGTRVRRWRRRG